MSSSSNQKSFSASISELLAYEEEFRVGLRYEIGSSLEPPVIHISDDADTSCEVADVGESDDKPAIIQTIDGADTRCEVADVGESDDKPATVQIIDDANTSSEVADVGESDDKPAIVEIIDLSSSSGTSFEAIDARELLDVPPKRTSTDLSSSPGTSFEIIDTKELSDLSPTEASTAPSSSPTDEDQNVPEKVRKWQVEYDAMLQKKDEEEKTKIQELRETAERELEEFYRSRSEAIAKTKDQNRKAEETRTEESRNVVDWDIVATLCDFSSKMKPGRKDVSRMREVLLRVASQRAGN